MNYVLYHANCADGFGAAWAAWRALGDVYCRYIPVSYGQPVPALEDAMDVYILDFSYDRETLRGIRERIGGDLTLIDHHETAVRELDGEPGTTLCTDRSAAPLAWEHFHPDARMPELLLYIEDRDLWRWKLPKSRAISAALSTYVPWTFPGWTLLHQNWFNTKPTLCDYGKSALHHIEGLVERAARAAQPLRIGDHTAMSVCSSLLQSEIAEAVLQFYPEVDFAAVYTVKPSGSTRFSLRSREDFDVSALAEKFGGGGHPRAAGFTWPGDLMNVPLPAATGEEVAA